MYISDAHIYSKQYSLYNYNCQLSSCLKNPRTGSAMSKSLPPQLRIKNICHKRSKNSKRLQKNIADV